ncbi:MAG: cellobiose phosphorylase [Candidatus Omnitrophica bacterium]|nr:cellobiose phosphorylase [Candidatus Omnitrophota bacterium]
MIYKFIDNKGTFIVKSPHKYNLYFPLTNAKGSLLSSISPNLAGDIKQDNEHFLTPPASIVDLKTNLLTRRDFFIKIDKQIIRLSFPYNDTVEIGFLYHKLIKKVEQLHIEILNFIPYNLDVEIMQIKIINQSPKTKKITPTSFIPLYGRSEKNLRDHRHVSSLLNRIQLLNYGIFLKPTIIFDERGHRLCENIYFAFGYEDDFKKPIKQFPTLDYFFGEGDILHPDAIEKDILTTKIKKNELFGKEVCASFRFNTKLLKPNHVTTYTIILGVDKNKASINKTLYKLNSIKKVKKILQETKNYWLNYLSNLEFDFKDKNFNNWLLWVKIQPLLRKLFGCSFLPHFDYGKGGRGWRDLWQDILTLLLTEPQKTKKLIINNFSGVRIDGSNATIITKDGKFIADRNKITRVWMDHGVWPYISLRFYIDKTAGIDILLKETTYFKDWQLKRAKEIDINFSQKDNILRTQNNKIYLGSILEHILIQNLVQFFNVGKHNIIRLENADWNDGLDMASNLGESVTFSNMYAHNLKDICFILEKLKQKTKTVFLLEEISILLDRIFRPINYNDWKAKQNILNKYLEATKNIKGKKIKIKIDDLIRDLSQKAEHLKEWINKNEWLKEGFYNGYYDNYGRRVEGKFKNRIRMTLPSAVFSIMGGIASDLQVKRIFKSIKKYLYDKKLKGFRLNTNFGFIYLALGRAFGFSYGDKENGAFFNHMVVMLANALYKRNFIKEGFEVINSIYKMATKKEAKIYPNIPEYFNSSGEGLYCYLTGSASWYIYTIVTEILGIKFVYGDILIKPKLVGNNFFGKNIEVKFNFYNKKICFSFIITNKKNKVYFIKKVFLENSPISSINNNYIITKKQILKIEKDIISIKIYLS